MKDVNEMSERQLLMELVEDKRKLEKLQYVKYAVAAIVIIALFVMLNSFMSRITASIQAYEKIISELQNYSQEMTDMFSNLPSSDGNTSMKDLMSYFKQLLEVFGTGN